MNFEEKLGISDSDIDVHTSGSAEIERVFYPKRQIDNSLSSEQNRNSQLKRQAISPTIPDLWNCETKITPGIIAKQKSPLQGIKLW